MNPRIVVAFDSSAAARAAIRSALALGGREEIVLLGTLPTNAPAGSLDAAMELLHDQAAVVRELGRMVRVRLDRGTRTRALFEALEEERPRLMIVGISRTSRRDARTARALMRRSRIPILTVPITSERRDHRARRIVVGIDFTPASQAALDQAAWLAQRLHAQMRLVHVQPLTFESARVDAHAAMEAMEFIAGNLETRSIQATPVVSYGNAAQAILAEAEGDPHAILVVGTRPRGPMRRTLLGSTAEEVLRHAPGAVMVVHRIDLEDFTLRGALSYSPPVS